MSEVFVNKVASSGLITIDLQDYLPTEPILSFDLKDHLFMGLILKEKDFREALKNFDWSIYKDQYVALFCSADAIVPVWAYMLVSVYLQPVARDIYAGTPAEMQKHIFLQRLHAIDAAAYREERVVVKGCGDVAIDGYAYAKIAQVLRPVAKSIMYGEPCSTVPIFKNKS